MARKIETTAKSKRMRPATSPEARENQLIAAAMDLAEQQILDGTASPSVITHFLKLGSTKESLEKEMLDRKIDLVSAQTESLHSSQRIEELYSEAINAMRLYNGQSEMNAENYEML